MTLDTKREIVAVGASAGGVQALISMAGMLPRDFPVAVVVVLHFSGGAKSALAGILDRAGALRARPAENGEPIEPGVIYVASTDRHLIIDDRTAYLTDGPTESGHRPSINALFRSVALDYGPAAIGLLLSGVLDDGVAGLAAIRSQGGVTAVQDPADCIFPAMPTNAIHAGVVDHVIPLPELGAALSKLAAEQVGQRQAQPDANLELENRIARGAKFAVDFDADKVGQPAGFSCPDCGGTLMTLSRGSFRCRIGHGWTAEALLKAQDVEVESALWVALRSLDEKAKLSETLADRAGAAGALGQRYAASAKEARHAAQVLRDHLSQVHERPPEAVSE
ncbi:chemotaxis protein CheB [Skermania sp. ID1734]|uniref:chemotaxis protein CheB n=1 Tax=Skermania sp. ID1734 TaxID=2597516 RepID=UPI0011802DEF|nr:chemotaxis protein CheB [Skermania sp. ID1734]TSE00940.1 chemotaxis protein CheB [Skermania sp. ID1734]